ncbi:MchS3 family protein [Cupriavidus basilensis]|uniref:MchS3 family protein n=1 Tax=Cupriavidus basilensis TaxID=68895 RepID=UPI0023E8EA70|nr:MchS3 family protein [Cupriavidus basilensis]MDF3887482.1 MchS3 family protein [Cupriavidus basilensis]
MKKLIFYLTLLSTTTITQASTDSTIDQIDRDKQKLANANNFSLGMVGFSGHISENEIIYTRILKNRAAKNIFTEIIRSDESTNEAKLYAACGLRTLSPPLFKKETPSILRKDGSASVLRADILNKEKMKDLIKSIDMYGCNKISNGKKENEITY